VGGDGCLFLGQLLLPGVGVEKLSDWGDFCTLSVVAASGLSVSTK
jgi:hypothetical protein